MIDDKKKQIATKKKMIITFRHGSRLLKSFNSLFRETVFFVIIFHQPTKPVSSNIRFTFYHTLFAIPNVFPLLFPSNFQQTKRNVDDHLKIVASLGP